jgi:hypothetical protein
MKKFHRVTVSAVMVLSVLFVADVADAATPSAQKVCVNKSTGVMRYVLKRGKQNCKKFEVRLMWNQAGATGATGATGPAGANGINGINGATGSAGATGASDSGAITQLSVCGAGGTELCKIGMTGPGGGHIFFVDYNDQYAGFNYLEAAPAGWGLGISVISGETTGVGLVDPQLKWCSDTSTGLGLTAWDKSAVGAGSTNTTTALATCTTGAFKAASTYASATESDWFLGSIGEMMLMYTNLRQAGVGGFSSSNYWSSSEYGGSYAWTQDFYNGSQLTSSKANKYYVRPVRAF